MKLTKRNHVTRIVAVMLVSALAISAAPARASAFGEARTAGFYSVFTATLTPVGAPSTAAEKLSGMTTDAAAFTTANRRVARVQAPLPRPVVTTQTRAATQSGTTRSADATAKTSVAPQPAAAAAPAPAPATNTLAEARAIVARYAATYKYVAGTTVEIGNTQGNGQAIVYYKSKRIIINANHTRSLESIIAHEIWHIIDWHHDNQINWGENVPPSNANDFRL